MTALALGGQPDSLDQATTGSYLSAVATLAERDRAAMLEHAVPLNGRSKVMV
jgi:hypothetical protein